MHLIYLIGLQYWSILDLNCNNIQIVNRQNQMGNMKSHEEMSIENLVKEYREIRKEEQGVVLEDPSNLNTYFLKQFAYAHKKQFDISLTRFKNHKQQEPSENVLNIVKISSQQFNTFCSTSFKIYVVYQYPSITLEEQIVARTKDNKYFEESELWSILQSCANGLSQVKPAFSLHPQYVFVVPDGALKILCDDLITEDHRSIQKQDIYYAPQKIINFNSSSSNLRKQGVFSLGMTLLHAALLKPVNGCYNYEKYIFMEDKLKEYLEELEKLNYSQEFMDMIAMVTEPVPNKRASLMEVHGILSKVWNTEGQGQENNENQSKQTFEEGNINSETNRNQDFSELKSMENQSNQKNSEIPSFYKEIKPTYTEREPNTSFMYNLSATQRPLSISPITTFAPKNFRPLEPYYPPTNKQNLYTDPKLLEMVRKDLREINELKKSTMLSTFGQYNNYSPIGLSSNSYLQPSYMSSYNMMDIGNMSYENYRHNSSYQPLSNTPLNFNQASSQNKLNQNKSSQKKGEIVKQRYSDGRIYQGRKINGLKEGQGKLLYTDGAYYEGNFHDDKMQGKGTLYYQKNKPAYVGEWLQDQFHGFGILYNQNPVTLNGSFNYSDFNMIEEYWFRYEGCFSNDNKSGKGKLFLTNGEQFQGIFQNDVMNGKGTFLAKMGDGRIQRINGIWEDNCLIEITDDA